MDMYQQLGYRVVWQACKDYFRSSKAKKQQILKELKSSWMDWWTNGLSVKVAEKLQTNAEEIRSRIFNMQEEE